LWVRQHHKTKAPVKSYKCLIKLEINPAIKTSPAVRTTLKETLHYVIPRKEDFPALPSCVIFIGMIATQRKNQF